MAASSGIPPQMIPACHLDLRGRLFQSCAVLPLGADLSLVLPLRFLARDLPQETVSVLRGRALGCGLITSSPLAPPLARDLRRRLFQS